ncbi:MAG: hypothetical protein P1P93_08390 [Gammaproteobacteria bacterium]|nr:hypothetical protein [Gammaproteobacteria bacterium]
MTNVKANFLLFNLLILPTISAFSAQLTDPTMPPDYLANSTEPNILITQTLNKPEWVLNSTVVDSYKQIAVINGKQVQIGDEINGATIMTISHQKVELLADNKRIELSLDKPMISRFQSQVP